MNVRAVGDAHRAENPSWGRAISTSMAIVALSAPFLGGLADRAGLCRPLFIGSTVIRARPSFSFLAMPAPDTRLLRLVLIAFELCIVAEGHRGNDTRVSVLDQFGIEQGAVDQEYIGQ